MATSISTAPQTPPNFTSQQLDDAITEYNQLISRIEHPHTALYREAHLGLHVCYAGIRDAKVVPDPRLPYVGAAHLAVYQTTAAAFREQMCLASEMVRKLRTASSEVKKRIVELEKKVAAEKRGLLMQADGMEMDG